MRAEFLIAINQSLVDLNLKKRKLPEAVVNDDEKDDCDLRANDTMKRLAEEQLSAEGVPLFSMTTIASNISC